jgi:eukaryotic-like serine/threonine-protein kinase
MRECPYCNHKNNVQARYCLKCRSPLEEVDTTPGTLLREIPRSSRIVSERVVPSQEKLNSLQSPPTLKGFGALNRKAQMKPQDSLVQQENIKPEREAFKPPEKKSPGKGSVECVATGVLRSGTLLNDRVSVKEMINVGGMGYIYLGYDLLMQKNVAIKEMIDKFTTRKERDAAIDRFEREAQMLCHLKHPLIPLFYDYFVDNQRYYLVMDFIEGKDLRMILEENMGKPLSMKQVVIWLLNICDVLTYLHAHDPPIIYRDLKPSNIIITPDNKVKLVDFGIARLFTPTVRGTMIGTQGYAPPEQYRGEAEPRSDIYSLGATLHHLLSGKDPQLEAPFHYEPLADLNPELPDSLIRLIERSLSMNPEERFQTAKQMRSELERVIRNEDDLSSILQEISSIEDEIKALKEKKENLLVPEIIASQRQMQLKDLKGLKSSNVWKQFRGNESRTGLSTTPAYLKGRIKWQASTNSKITASPVLDSNGNIYVGSHGGTLYSFDHNGDFRWEFKARGGISCAAAVDNNENILVPSEDGTLYSLNPDSSRTWSFNVRDNIKNTPLILGEYVYVAGQNGYLYCLTTNGDKLWDFNAETPVSCPVSADLRSGNIYFGNKKGEFFAMSYDGRLLWVSYFPKMITSAPAVAPDGTIYAGCEDGKLYSISPSQKINWSFKTRSWIRSSPAISKDGSIFLGSDDHFIYCISDKGKERWRFDANDSILSSPAVCDDGKVFFATREGFLIALQPQGKSLWWLSLEDMVTSSPAITPEGTLMICTVNGRLITVI